MNRIEKAVMTALLTFAAVVFMPQTEYPLTVATASVAGIVGTWVG